MLEHSPSFTIDDAERITRERYGRRSRAHALTSERDQNFFIEASDGAPALVLKIANALEDRALLEAQQQVLSLLAQRGLPIPHAVCTAAGDDIAEVPAPDGRRHFVWAITHLQGRLLADIRHRSPALLDELGAAIGRLTTALAVVNAPAFERDFHWDLSGATERVAAVRPAISDETLGVAIDATLARVERYVTPMANSLHRAVIHNDLNDHNILVAGERVSGIVDFGDMLFGWRVADLAIAAAYAMLDAEDPLAILASLVRGAQRECAFDDRELEVVFELACLRLALSASIAVDQQRARPDNHYLGVSQSAIRRTLPNLVRIPHGLAAAVVREAAGLEPVARAVRVREWLHTNASAFSSVLPIDVRSEPSVVLDLGIASSLISGTPEENAEPA
ncbi:MAG TPA: phosphotransferase, partial [Gemmatimonadaceae bacterium]|nr:phosphotransferase [Gemmatimonadaceae bacterium]